MPRSCIWKSKIIAWGQLRFPTIQAPAVTSNAVFCLACAFTHALNTVDFVQYSLRDEGQINEIVEEKRRRRVTGKNPGGRILALRLRFENDASKLVFPKCWILQ